MCLCVRSPISIAHRSISGIPAGAHSPAAIDWVGLLDEQCHHLVAALAGKSADQSMVAQTVLAKYFLSLCRIHPSLVDGCVFHLFFFVSETRKRPNKGR